MGVFRKDLVEFTGPLIESWRKTLRTTKMTEVSVWLHTPPGFFFFFSPLFLMSSHYWLVYVQYVCDCIRYHGCPPSLLAWLTMVDQSVYHAEFQQLDEFISLC